MHSGSRRAGAAQRGFTYVGLLLGVALLGAGLGIAASSWTLQHQREVEREQLWRGRAIAAALVHYHAGPKRAPVPAGAASSAPAPAPAGGEWPRRLDDLLEDRRGPQPVRHLRRVYPDPCTGKPDWQLERNDLGGIVAVRSRCRRPALLREGLDETPGIPRLSDRRFGSAGAPPVETGTGGP